jgi:hypothetical protein
MIWRQKLRIDSNMAGGYETFQALPLSNRNIWYIKAHCESLYELESFTLDLFENHGY